MRIYIVNGYGGSGKDTFENMVRFSTKNHANKLSMIDIVKYYADFMGWEGGKTDADRRFLSDLKDALARWNNIPRTYVCERILECDRLKQSYVFVDAREKEDIDAIKEWCKERGFECKTILVDRGITKQYGNHADDEVMNYNYDITIMNTGSLSDLEKCAKSFIVEEEL